jgi:uncharacterized membrane protein YoaK (UPF0700 family)
MRSAEPGTELRTAGDAGRSPAEQCALNSIRQVVRSTSREANYSWILQSLLIVLSVTAGSTDTIGFLELDGLFTAHITGNLIVLAAHIFEGGDPQTAKILSVPVFVLTINAAVVLAAGLKKVGCRPLCPLLLLELAFLLAFLLLNVATDPRINSNAASAIVAGMLGVSAMAIQNVLVQISLKGAPSTAVMTTNVTRAGIDLGDMLLGHNETDRSDARKRVMRTLPVIVGFVVGCGLGVACEAALGLWSLALPVGLALLACAIGLAMPVEAQP